MDLEKLLQEITVLEYDAFRNGGNVYLEGWWAVANTNGIVAYFFRETDACRFRLDYINRLLNPTEG